MLAAALNKHGLLGDAEDTQPFASPFFLVAGAMSCERLVISRQHGLELPLHPFKCTAQFDDGMMGRVGAVNAM
jgi:hypothetical protein